MVKWKIGLGIYCALVLYISSMSPGGAETGCKFRKAIHLVEYAIMGILAWGAFSGESAFRGVCWLFVPVLELRMSAGRTGWEAGVPRKCGMRRPMRPVPLSDCLFRWFLES